MNEHLFVLYGSAHPPEISFSLASNEGRSTKSDKNYTPDEGNPCYNRRSLALLHCREAAASVAWVTSTTSNFKKIRELTILY